MLALFLAYFSHYTADKVWCERRDEIIQEKYRRLSNIGERWHQCGTRRHQSGMNGSLMSYAMMLMLMSVVLFPSLYGCCWCCCRFDLVGDNSFIDGVDYYHLRFLKHTQWQIIKGYYTHTLILSWYLHCVDNIQYLKIIIDLLHFHLFYCTQGRKYKSLFSFHSRKYKRKPKVCLFYIIISSLIFTKIINNYYNDGEELSKH